jgi:hypothetical protein
MTTVGTADVWDAAAGVTFSAAGFALHPMPNKRTPDEKHATINNALT